MWGAIQPIQALGALNKRSLSFPLPAWPFMCIDRGMGTTNSPTTLNLATRKTITKAQMQALQELNQAFSRTFSLSLSAWLGANVQISMMGAERQVFTTLLENIDVEHTYFSFCHFSPVEGAAIISMELKLIAPVIHLGLGGVDTDEIEEPRELTDIDVAIMDILMTRLCGELNQLWAQCGLRSEYGQRILPATLGRLFPRTEDMLCVTYRMHIGNMSGVMQIALATAVSETVLRELVRQDSKRVQNPATRQILRSRLSNMNIEGALETLPFKVTAQEIVGLEPGAIVRTGINEGTDFLFVISGERVWTASAIAVGERRGAHLIDRRTE